LKLHVILMAFLFLLPTVSLAGQFKVTKVYDGNTVKAESHDIIIKIRLVAIDAPETAIQSAGQEVPCRVGIE